MFTPPKKTPAQQYATDLYATLMEEVKIRLLSIEQALNGHLVFPAWIIREFCYLQLRMICELIALGCLVAHGDIKETQKGRLRKAWDADRIFATLGGLYPDFYPAPMRFAEPIGGNLAKFEPVVGGFLTKEDLLVLNNKCGQFLHRGTMKSLLSPEPIYEGFPDVVTWATKIHTLLGVHRLRLFDGALFVCLMTKGEGGRVKTQIAVPVPDP